MNKTPLQTLIDFLDKEYTYMKSSDDKSERLAADVLDTIKEHTGQNLV